MKNLKLLSLLWIIIVAWTLAWCWNNKNISNDDNTWDVTIETTNTEADAVINYNDTLVELASECVMSEESIRNNYNDSSSTIEDIETAINNTISECESAKGKINELWWWEWDNSLLDGIIAIIDNDIAYYKKFNELLPYLQKEQLTEEENEKYQSIVYEAEVLDEELAKTNENLITIQEEFAKNHWYELETNEVAE